MKNTYLIYGNDYELIKREIDKLTIGITDVASYDLSIDKVDLLLDDASCISLFGDKKVVIGNNCLFLTTKKTNVDHDLDYLTRYLESEDDGNTVILTVLEGSLDGKKNIVKLLKKRANVIYKEQLDIKDLPSFVVGEFKNNGYKIDYKTANYFVSYVGSNVDILLSEIEKMIVYKDDDHNVTINDINDISSRGFKDNIFDLSNGIMEKNYKKVFDCYQDLKTLNVDASSIIGSLAKHFTFVYKVKILSNDGLMQQEIASKLNVHPYRVKLAAESFYTSKDVEKILLDLSDLDYGIKSGNLNKDDALENFLLRL